MRTNVDELLPIWRRARGSGHRLAGALAALLVAASAGSAQALVITPTFSSSITSLANASQIESAFNTVAQVFDRGLTSPVTVNIGVSFGSVGGQTLPSNDLAASLDNLYGYFSYNDLRSYLTDSALSNPQDKVFAAAVAKLPSRAPAGVANYVVPYAEAKALGLAPGDQTATDGFVGFNAKYKFDFNPADGITAGTYDFEALAYHEIDEVLGRISGLEVTAPSFRSEFDLFRYSAPGAIGFSYNSAAYLSIDGGKTRLGNFNIAGGGDRSDWAAGPADAQLAFLATGKAYALGTSDWTGLDALGWNQTASSWFLNGPQTLVSQPGDVETLAGVPEPATWSILLAGLALIGASMRRRRRAIARLAIGRNARDGRREARGVQNARFVRFVRFVVNA